MFRAGDIFKTIVHAQQEDRNVYLNVADQNLHGAVSSNTIKKHIILIGVLP